MGVIMKIQPIQNNQPTFQMKWKQRQLTNLMLTSITLDNGNRLVTRQIDTYKLQSLYDEFGEWIKSKLRYYKGKQVIKEVTSERIKR